MGSACVGLSASIDALMLGVNENDDDAHTQPHCRNAILVGSKAKTASSGRPSKVRFDNVKLESENAVISDYILNLMRDSETFQHVD